MKMSNTQGRITKTSYYANKKYLLFNLHYLVRITTFKCHQLISASV